MLHKNGGSSKRCLLDSVHIMNYRLSRNSSREKVFNKSQSYYEDALNESGYKYKISSTSIKSDNKNKKRRIIWFNPPFNESVSTNVAQTFLKLIDKHFPCPHRFL